MERLKNMRNCLMACVEGELAHLDTVDAHELGEAVDMIKDCEEAMYYHTIREAMEESEHNTNNRDMDKHYGRMYYPTPRMYYTIDPKMKKHIKDEDDYTYYDDMYMMPYKPLEQMRDKREGRSPMSRKTYMESKEMHKDKPTQLKELEHYMQELANDIVEMIEGASPEEKQMLQQRISAISAKIQ
jgi:hypothetical protein